MHILCSNITCLFRSAIVCMKNHLNEHHKLQILPTAVRQFHIKTSKQKNQLKQHTQSNIHTQLKTKRNGTKQKGNL